MTHISVILMCCALVSCRSTEKIVYLQDVTEKTTVSLDVYSGIRIQPKDILSIIVSSKSPFLVIPYNLPLHAYQAGSDATSVSYTQRLLGYMVDVEGNIDFPQYGKLKVTGLTREQLAEILQNIIREGIVNDAIVNVEFMNFRISVLGEVSKPGTFDLQNDKITIFEALGRAGDLTIYGKRDDVLVMREQNGVINYYRVDLRSARIHHSPVYYLQQNDVVYVSPNPTMAARTQVNENKSLGIWISLASFLTSLAVIIFR